MAAKPTYAGDPTGWRAVEEALPRALRAGEGDEPTEEHMPLDGLDVHLDRHGSRKAATVAVLLHGGGGNGRLLAPVGRLVADLGARAVAPDLPGFGLTACRPRELRYERWVAVAAALIEQEGHRAERVVVAGFSMGGLLAVHATARLSPGSVDAVLASTLIDPSDPRTRSAAGRIPVPHPRLLRPLDSLRLPIGLVAPLSRMANEPRLCRAVATNATGAARRVPLRFWRSWIEYRPAVELERFDHAPVTLAHPTDDRWTPPELSRRVLARLAAPTRELELPDGGHYPVEPRAVAALADALGELLAGDEPDRTPLAL